METFSGLRLSVLIKMESIDSPATSQDMRPWNVLVEHAPTYRLAAHNMVKFVSSWHRVHSDFSFPEGMPVELQEKVINRRRQIMVYAYIQFGLGQETISQKLWLRICRELEELQAAWGYEFGFYDFMFDDWDISKEDHLLTNKGLDSGVVNAALALLTARKASARRVAAMVG